MLTRKAAPQTRSDGYSQGAAIVSSRASALRFRALTVRSRPRRRPSRCSSLHRGPDRRRVSPGSVNCYEERTVVRFEAWNRLAALLTLTASRGPLRHPIRKSCCRVSVIVASTARGLKYWLHPTSTDQGVRTCRACSSCMRTTAFIVVNAPQADCRDVAGRLVRNIRHRCTATRMVGIQRRFHNRAPRP